MISAVALDKFRPDATRSGYFPLRVGGDADAGADLPEQDELDSSSSGSEDEEAPDHDEIENACDAMVRGREFVSEEFCDWAETAGIYLYHIGVQAPWQNGVAERSGGTLKAVAHALVTQHTLLGAAQMAEVVGEAVAAYNGHPATVCYWPAAAGHGGLLTSLEKSLAAHSLIENRPSLARQLALRKTARVAMVRLHYSRALRPASLARSRAEPAEDQQPQPGDIVFFFRQQKANRPKGAANAATSSQRRRLELRRWHGPGMLIATEVGSDGMPGGCCFVSFRGQITRCAREHVRKGSSLEQLAAGAWQDAVDEMMAEIEATRLPVTQEEPAVDAEPPADLSPEFPANVQGATGDVAQPGPDYNLQKSWRRSAHRRLHWRLLHAPPFKVCLEATYVLNHQHYQKLRLELRALRWGTFLLVFLGWT